MLSDISWTDRYLNINYKPFSMLQNIGQTKGTHIMCTLFKYRYIKWHENNRWVIYVKILCVWWDNIKCSALNRSHGQMDLNDAINDEDNKNKRLKVLFLD